MSGHSKWSTIKRKKGAEDAKRAKIFTRLARDITIAARDGVPDENGNPKLKLAIQKARAANMPKENIERAIKRGTGELEGSAMEEITYEGYGIDGVAFMVDVLTDNRNRALAEVKRVFTKSGGSLAAAGSVAWQFDRNGYITLQGENLDFDQVFLVAAEAGANDVVEEDGVLTVYTPREALSAVETALEEAGYVVDEAELRWMAQNEVEVGEQATLQNMRVLEQLEELDDVQSVATNLSISESALSAFEQG